MVKKVLWSLLGIAALVGGLPLHAKDLADYKAGDVADADIVAQVPLDVVDPVATAARRLKEAEKTPAIFLSVPDAAVTNAIVREFSAAFAGTRTNFLAALAKQFPAGGSADAEVFSNFVAGFNKGQHAFPVSDNLARKWASGDAADGIRLEYQGDILRMMRRPIRPDELPAGFVLGDTFRLVAVAGADDHPTPAEVERGKVVSEMTPLSRLQMLLRHQFDRPDQALGRDLGAFLKPNCFLDADLTQKARNRDVNEMVVLMHYAAGQVIVRQGQVIDAAAAAAVAALNEKLAPARQAQQASEQLKSQQEQLRRQQAALQQEQEKARQAEADATKIRDNTLALQAQILAAHTRNLWLLGALAAVLALVASVVLLFLRRRPSPLNVYPVAAALPAAQPAQLPLQSATSLELAPHLANAVKEAVVQELAAQRGELIKAQQHAAADLADLIHRLDHLHAPLQERLKTYEGRIVELEKQLASRTEENQELLRAKLELLRRQLETEKRGSVRSDWSTAIN